MKTFELTFQVEIEAESAEDAKDELFKEIEEETNESCESYFHRNLKVKQVKAIS